MLDLSDSQPSKVLGKSEALLTVDRVVRYHRERLHAKNADKTAMPTAVAEKGIREFEAAKALVEDSESKEVMVPSEWIKLARQQEKRDKER